MIIWPELIHTLDSRLFALTNSVVQPVSEAFEVGPLVEFHGLNHRCSAVSGHAHHVVLCQLSGCQRLSQPVRYQFPHMIVREVGGLQTDAVQRPFFIDKMHCQAHIRLRSPAGPEIRGCRVESHFLQLRGNSLPRFIVQTRQCNVCKVFATR